MLPKSCYNYYKPFQLINLQVPKSSPKEKRRMLSKGNMGGKSLTGGNNHLYSYTQGRFAIPCIQESWTEREYWV